MKLTKLFKEFFRSEKTGGLLLIACTAVSLTAANSTLGNEWLHLWEIKIAGLSIVHWVNDGLMAVFFLLIGLELEREIYKGELSSIKDALLPISAAAGGILVPAGIYLLFNFGLKSQSGIGIPMATDIAFALGILSLSGKRVPAALKLFLTALAVIDDLAAIIIIAVFYSKSIMLVNLFIALGIFGGLLVMNRLRVNTLWVYLPAGAAMWFFMLHSGVHATISGVLLAFAIPFGDGGKKSASYRLQHFLHNPVAYIILPVFALANTAIVIGSGWGEMFSLAYSQGIALGLLLGKPLGILLFSFLAVTWGIGRLPAGLNWKMIAGAGLLGGIGFTMSIFITLLAFDDVQWINNAKLTILLASLGAGLLGHIVLRFALPHKAAGVETGPA
ncbi:MAG: Na+/H+ antiporter NhaA [Bacteroidia bacterium]|jgi:NhaA family Na+:H+ antiporter|nr:Na+/H+ antiporter NhaA [Bacteroidia bacterium]